MPLLPTGGATSDRKPAPAPRPAPAPAPAVPIAGTETPPSLANPQPGSTAAVGKVGEGIYESMFGYSFVGADGRFSRKLILGMHWGSMQIDGLNWTFKDDVVDFSGFGTEKITGNGTFSPMQSMEGSYSVAGRTSKAYDRALYSVANALAVTQDSLTGEWHSDASSGHGMTLRVAPDGALTGQTSGSQLGVCDVTGAVINAEEGSQKNMWQMVMSAAQPAGGASSTCKLGTDVFTSQAAIVFTPASLFERDGYFRAFTFLVHTPSQAFSNVVRRSLPEPVDGK